MSFDALKPSVLRDWYPTLDFIARVRDAGAVDEVRTAWSIWQAVEFHGEDFDAMLDCIRRNTDQVFRDPNERKRTASTRTSARPAASGDGSRRAGQTHHRKDGKQWTRA